MAENRATRQDIEYWESIEPIGFHRHPYETFCTNCGEWLATHDFVIDGHQKTSTEWGPGEEWCGRAWCHHCDTPIFFADGYP